MQLFRNPWTTPQLGKLAKRIIKYNITCCNTIVYML